jgi:hypothetical protein
MKCKCLLQALQQASSRFSPSFGLFNATKTNGVYRSEVIDLILNEE